MSAPTLDDIATLLLQLEPDDCDDFARAREQLADLTLANVLGIAAQPLVARAVRALKPLADGTATDPAAAYADVCALLDQAMGGAPVGGTPAPASDRPTTDGGTTARGEMVAETLSADVDVDLLKDFLLESRDCLASSEAALLALEQSPDDAEAVNSVFRAFHTIKGTSAFLGLSRVSAFAHEAEALLARVREKSLAYTSACADLALRSGDMLKALLDAVEATLHAAGPGGAIAAPDGYDALVAALVGYDGTQLAALPVSTPSAFAPNTPTPGEPAPAAERRQSGDRRQTGDRRQDPAATSEADQFVRVRLDRLDRLVDIVGELVIAQSMVASDGALADSAAAGQSAPRDAPQGAPALAKKIAHAGKIVRELQELSMGMRMVPLKATFQKLARLVRDVSAKLGKDVEFVTEGEETEIDRTLADVIGDPLVHMLRNALDHGVESPDARERAGKQRRGRVRLAAAHAGGAVVIELSDDGRGLDRERILRKAVEKGLVPDDGRAAMGDAEVFQLIFAPGFSTAEQITDVSGRGVGMDVVKSNIERARGRVEITSRLGEGTTFTVRLPVTLAVTDGMLVRVGAERYVVPTTNIHMSFRPEPGMLHTVGGRGEVVRLRGEVMPVVRLHRLFDIPGAEPDPTKALLMLVGDARQRKTALLIDELLGQQQVVAKALGDGVGLVPGVAGGAILGDGRVGLILDVPAVIALADRGEALRERAA